MYQMMKYGMVAQQKCIRRMINSLIKCSNDLGFSYKLDLVNSLDNTKFNKLSMIWYAKAGDITYLDGNAQHLVHDKDGILLICPFDFEIINNNISYFKVDDPKLLFYYLSNTIKRNGVFIKDEELCNRFPGAVISKGCKIADDVIIQPGVVINEGTIIDNGVVIEAGSVIGSTGLLWTWDTKNGKKIMLSLTGGTHIQSGCFISSNVSIVRGACNENTIIGENTMIAPGSAIGHGCKIGKNTHIANNVTLSGGVHIGENCFLGSASVIQPALSLHENSVLGAASVLTKSTTERGIYVGTPAIRTGDIRSQIKGVPRLPI